MRTDPTVRFEPGAELGLNLPGRAFQDGVSQSGRERNHLFLNLGGRSFRDVSPVSGLDHPADGRSFALFDFDRDGREDIAVVNANTPLLQLFRNETPGADTRGVIGVRFVGSNRRSAPARARSARDGFGARVTVSLGERTLLREHRAGEGFAAQNSATMRIGIGDHRVAERLTVLWPSGTVGEIEDVPAGSLVVVYEDAEQSPGGKGVVRSAYRAASGLFEGGSRLAAAPIPSTGVLLPGRTGRAPLRLLTTMATWCESCRKELPQVAILRDALAGQVDLVGVPVDETDSASKLHAWMSQQRPAYSLLLDLAESERTAVTDWVAGALHRDALPASILTDADGRVLETRLGVPSVSQLKRWLRHPSL